LPIVMFFRTMFEVPPSMMTIPVPELPLAAGL
jgi:hypothetical protein